MKLSELWEAQAMGGREDPSNGLVPVMADLRHRPLMDSEKCILKKFPHEQ